MIYGHINPRFIAFLFVIIDIWIERCLNNNNNKKRCRTDSLRLNPIQLSSLMYTLVRTNIIFFFCTSTVICVTSCRVQAFSIRTKEKGGGQFKLWSSFSMYNKRDTGVVEKKEEITEYIWNAKKQNTEEKSDDREERKISFNLNHTGRRWQHTLIRTNFFKERSKKRMATHMSVWQANVKEQTLVIICIHRSDIDTKR
jgi:hypothetical protein